MKRGDYMTKEEALRRVEGYLTDDFVTEDFDELEDIMKALKQEPCEDCVSRKSIDQNIYDYAESNGLSYANMKNYILDAPSVTPTRKKGKWIAKENIHGLEKFYKCSNCGNHCLYEYVEIGFKNAKTKYCPNCGAEMESGE
jgi:Pyruvate/2-oxoacid:ferredoxin oxidoreductase delta subunit